MPKKKLTKTQVIKKLRTVSNAMYDLFLDKFGHGSASMVPISQDKLRDMHNAIVNASQRVVKK
tara:strand:- start:42 stop:230 length:189 start_codon:yes stop_codon:yes gene_type:complete